MIDLILRGGTVVLPAGPVTADIAVHDGVIAGIGSPDTMPRTRRTIDVSGADVLPGVIDVHVHFNTFSWHIERIGRTSQSTAHGGITTIVGFLLFPPETEVEQGIDQLIAEGGRESVIDFAFHLVLRPGRTFGREIEAALSRGITSFKTFMAYKGRFMLDDGALLDAFQRIAEAKGLTMVHAENGAVIDWLEQRSAAEGRRAPADYLATRPALAEAEAIGRAIRFAGAAGCPLYVVHVSTVAGLTEIQAAKALGMPVYGETCPQYLLLDSSLIDRVGPLAKIAPPLRTPQDRDELWRGLQAGHLDIVASDHGAYAREAKVVGWEDIWQAPFGSPGTETLLPLLYSEGVLRRGLPLTWLARITSEAPARIFGLSPRKGAIDVGADADLVVLDPARRRTIAAGSLHTASDFTLFEGFQLQGGPVFSVLRGQVVLADGELQADPGYGRYLPRGPACNWSGNVGA